MAKIKKWHDHHEYLIWIILATIVLRIPNLFEPYWYGDEGIYLTLGLALRKGLVFYSQIHDNKPPLLYLFSAMAGNLMMLRMMMVVWNGINIFLIGKLAERILSKKSLVYLVAGIFAIFTTLPWLEGNIANGEVFMIMPVTAALLVLVRTMDLGKNKWVGYLTTGLLFSAGFLFKVPVMFDFGAVLVWFLLCQKKVFSQENIKWAGLMIVGFGLPILTTIIYYWVVGAGDAYIRAAFFQNVGYLSSWGGGGGSGLPLRMFVAVLSFILVWFLTRKENVYKRLIIVWMIGSLFGSLLSGRPYPHYLIQIVPAAALLVGVVLDTKKIGSFVASGLMAVLVVSAIFYYKFGFYSASKYYKNFSLYATKRMSLEDYYKSFDGRVMQTYEVARYLKMRTTEDESIFIWGDEPYIYALSERLPPGRFTVAYHVMDFDGKEETLAAIKEKDTRYLVIMEGEGREWSELISLVNTSYTLAEKIGGALIYRTINGSKIELK